jgi:hypothetical protein
LCSEQGRGAIDPVPGEQARPTPITGIVQAWRIGGKPVGLQRVIDRRVRCAPEHPAFVLGQML